MKNAQYWTFCAMAILAGCTRTTAEQLADENGWQVQGECLYWHGKSAPPYVRVSTADGPNSRTAHVAGRIVWDDHSTARIYTPANGRIETLYAEPGARVRRGQPLLELASGDYAQWQSELRKAQADSETARRADARARDLLALGVIAQRDAEQAQADRERTDAELARAEARMAQLGAHDKTVDGRFILRSPIDGVVVDRVASVGTEVRADAATPLLVVTDPQRLNIVVDLPEYLSQQVKPGLELTFTRAGVGAGVAGGRARLTAVPLAVDTTTRTVRARGKVVATAGAVPGEAYVQVDIPLASVDTGAVMVPNDALVLVDSRYYVYTVSGRQYLRRAVSIGELGESLIEVKSGLQPGETVVVDGGLYLERLLEQGAGSPTHAG